MTSLTREIGINLTDPIFRGVHHGTQRHEDDFEDVIQRGVDAGCKKFMVTGSDLKESEHAIEIAKAHRKYTCRAIYWDLVLLLKTILYTWFA